MSACECELRKCVCVHACVHVNVCVCVLCPLVCYAKWYFLPMSTRFTAKAQGIWLSTPCIPHALRSCHGHIHPVHKLSFAKRTQMHNVHVMRTNANTHLHVHMHTHGQMRARTHARVHTHTCTHSPRCAHHTPCLCASHMPSNVRLPPMNLRSPQLVQVNSPCQPANQQLVHPARECYLPRAPSSAAGGHRKARPCDIPTPGGGSSSLGINTGGAVGLICWLAGVLNAPAVHPI